MLEQDRIAVRDEKPGGGMPGQVVVQAVRDAFERVLQRQLFIRPAPCGRRVRAGGDAGRVFIVEMTVMADHEPLRHRRDPRTGGVPIRRSV